MDKKRMVSLIVNCILGVAVIILIIIFAKAAKSGSLLPGKNGSVIKNVSADGDKLYDKAYPIKEDVEISTEVISDGLRNLGQLVTEEYFFTQVEEYTDTKSWYFLSSTSSFKYSYDGSVTAGVQCNQILVDKDEENKVITINVPKAEILSVTIDYDSFQMLEEKTGLWNKMNISNYNDSLVEFEKAAREKAMSKGIVEKANENAILLIKNAAESLVGTNEYSIEFVQK